MRWLATDGGIMNLCYPFVWLFRRAKNEQEVAEHQGHALGGGIK